MATTAHLVAVSTDLIADIETPVSAFAKLAGERPCYLLESAELNDVVGRFSILGFDPFFEWECRGNQVTVRIREEAAHQTVSPDPLDTLRKELERFCMAPSHTDGPSPAAAVGYIGYDAVRFFEPTVGPSPADDLHLPDMVFIACEVTLVFDHKARRLQVTVLADTSHTMPDLAYEKAKAKLSATLLKLQQPILLSPLPINLDANVPEEPLSTYERADFEKMVRDAKEFIRAGDIFQVVLSQRFQAPFSGSPLDLYRALRFVNPSPYLFCLHLPEGRALIGSSPEVHVRVQDGQVDIRPIAGTRPRGATTAEDEAHAADLLSDPKERAEHVMLVDLARNDVGRIAEYSSVKVTDFMTIERYSHVMHIVSNVIGKLHPGRSSFDVMRATFPAGTVSGSPKVRAMQIINQMEITKRGTYAGAVASFRFDGNLDSCITLRSILLQNHVAYVQTGAGIVADSTPEGEYLETVNKARGMLRAIALAKQISSAQSP